MPEKLTLYSYSKRSRNVNLADSQIIEFLKTVKPGKLLIISAGSAGQAAKKGFEVTVVDDDLRAIKKARKANPGVKYEYSDFFSFSKREKKNAFDCIIDNGYSSRLRRRGLNRFYKEISKMLRFDGCLLSKTLSVADEYCQEHCPKRHWTYIGKEYVNFFDNKSITKVVRRHGFKVRNHRDFTYEGDAPNTYNILSAVQKSMKL